MSAMTLGGRDGKRRGRGPRGSKDPGGPELQVAPMLDMAFQLLAFFIMTFQPPSPETRIDLYLPTSPRALPSRTTPSRPPIPEPPVPDPRASIDLDLDHEFTLTARANPTGELASLQLNESPLRDLDDLSTRLSDYKRKVAGPEPIKVQFKADENLRFEYTARILNILTESGVAAISLDEPEPVGDAGGGGRS